MSNLTTGSITTPRQDNGPYVGIDTAYGKVVAAIHTKRAPITAGNFLRYLDAGCYQNATFYRSARPGNDKRSPKIRIIQGGIDPTCRTARFPPITHESTAATGLSHVDGTLSAVRWEPGSATSEFFIVLGDTPALDFGGARHPDKQGYAVFGRVSHGLDIVRRISALATGSHGTIQFMQNQTIVPPARMRIARLEHDVVGM